MGTIKFRAWDIKKNEYSREYIAIGQGGEPYLNVANFWSEYVYECEEEDYIIEQFTGLTDKNGKEIYEGDIFEDEPGEYDVIKQPSGQVGLYLCHIEDNYGDDLNHYYFDKMEVIGNIHENRELLNEAEK